MLIARKRPQREYALSLHTDSIFWGLTLNAYNTDINIPAMIITITLMMLIMLCPLVFLFHLFLFDRWENKNHQDDRHGEGQIKVDRPGFIAYNGGGQNK